jgi:hyaluronoglucosaminidase
MVRFLGENGFNTYIYAPKDDPYHRSMWRRAYPRRQRESLRELIGVARRCFVDFVFTVSPGLDLIYSSEGDRRLLLTKLRMFTDLGCGCVGLFFDDISLDLSHDEDKKAFSSLGKAHVFLLNSIQDELSKSGGTRLIFCPTCYASNYLGMTVSENEYLMEIGEGLDSKILVLWTGRRVVSITITAEDVLAYEKVVRRKPFLWDNYPVNDYYRSGDASHDRPRLNMGPFTGRSPKIIGHLAGYVSNPMNEPEASKIPLLTLSSYLNSPSRYLPDASFQRAIENLFSGEERYNELKLLVESSRASPLDLREAEQLRELVRELMTSSRGPDDLKWASTSTVLESRLKAYAGLREMLLGSVRNRRFLSEFEPVIGKVQKLATLGLSCLKLAQRVRESPRHENEVARLKEEARRKMEQVRKDRTQALGEVVFDDSLSEIGLPRAQKESPIAELFSWSLKIAEEG